jgi:hypothetical protein
VYLPADCSACLNARLHVPPYTKATSSLLLTEQENQEKKRGIQNCNVIKEGKENCSAWWYPSQSTKSLTQTCETGVLIPVKLQNWGCRSRCYSKGNSDNGFSWSYTRRMPSSNKELRMRWVNIR